MGMSMNDGGRRIRGGSAQSSGAQRWMRPVGLRPTRVAVAVAVVAVAAACAPKISIRTETAEPAPDFSTLRSFAILTEADRDLEVDAAIEEEIRRGLLAKGLEQAAPTEADALVAYRAHAVDLAKRQLDADPDSNYYRIVQYVEGTLVIDVFDAGARRRIWHGQAVFDEADRERLAGRKLEAVADLLAELPAGR